MADRQMSQDQPADVALAPTREAQPADLARHGLHLPTAPVTGMGVVTIEGEVERAHRGARGGKCCTAHATVQKHESGWAGVESTLPNDMVSAGQPEARTIDLRPGAQAAEAQLGRAVVNLGTEVAKDRRAQHPVDADAGEKRRKDGLQIETLRGHVLDAHVAQLQRLDPSMLQVRALTGGKTAALEQTKPDAGPCRKTAIEGELASPGIEYEIGLDTIDGSCDDRQWLCAAPCQPHRRDDRRMSVGLMGADQGKHLGKSRPAELGDMNRSFGECAGAVQCLGQGTFGGGIGGLRSQGRARPRLGQIESIVEQGQLRFAQDALWITKRALMHRVIDCGSLLKAPAGEKLARLAQQSGSCGVISHRASTVAQFSPPAPTGLLRSTRSGIIQRSRQPKDPPVKYLVALAVLVILSSGCASLTRQPEPPRIAVASLQFVSMEMFEQRYRVGLRLQNPNNFDLPLSGLEFTLSLNDTPFASGVSPEAVTLPRFGEAAMSVEVTSNLFKLLEQAQAINRAGAEAVRYRIHGSVAVSEFAIRLPFDTSGEVRLSPH